VPWATMRTPCQTEEDAEHTSPETVLQGMEGTDF
jgi:hypothetical protein